MDKGRTLREHTLQTWLSLLFAGTAFLLLLNE
jgi:hypothetical protein